MEPQFTADDLREIAKFIDAVNEFIDAHPTILDVEIISERFNNIPYYDSNGDKLGQFQIADWGAMGFVPVKEIED